MNKTYPGDCEPFLVAIVTLILQYLKRVIRNLLTLCSVFL